MTGSRLLVVGGLALLGAAHLSWADWAADGGSLNLSPDSAAMNPSIAVAGAVPYVAWNEYLPATTQWQRCVSHYNGAAWVQDIQVATGNEGTSPQLAASGTVPYLSWEVYAPGLPGYQGFFQHYDGAAWVPDGSALDIPTTVFMYQPVLAFAGTVPYAFTAQGGATSCQMFLYHYNGSAWVPDGSSLNAPSLNFVYPAIACSGAVPYVAWIESSGLYVQHYDGAAWVPDGGSLTGNILNGWSPGLAVTGSTPYVAWSESVGSAPSQVVVKHYTGTAWVPDGGSLNVNSAHAATWPALTLVGTTPYVVWSESDGTANQIYVKHFNGTDWVADGGSLNVDPARSASLVAPAITYGNGKLYVAWSESSGSQATLYVKHGITTTPTVTPTATPILTSTVTPTVTSNPLEVGAVRAYPNPGRDRIQFMLNLNQAQEVKIQIFNLLGERVTLLQENLPAGPGQMVWNCQNAAPGIYIARVYIGKHNAVTLRLGIAK